MNLLWRLLILVLLMALVAWLDWRRRGPEATRWREYVFLLLAGLIGGIIGIANDHITATISPEYFFIGKGIALGDGFRRHVTELGFHAGLLAGVVIGGAFLMANNPKPNRSRLSAKKLLRFALYPILGALILVPLGSVLAYYFDPLNFSSDLSEALSPEQIGRFLAVWGVHLGLYAGGLVGAMTAVLGIRRIRRSQ